jgi:hypothetical protein
MEVRPEDLAQFPVRRPIVTARNPDILMVDEKVSIFDVLRVYCGLSVPGIRYKSHCPFAAEHAEGTETERSFQVYETNSGWCFQHQRQFTPTTVVMYAVGCSRRRAANLLMERYGIERRQSYQARYGDVARWVESHQQSPGDVQELVTALSADLASDPVYAAVEFEDEVRQVWDHCLAALDQVAARATADVLRRWYDVARRRLLEAARLTEVTRAGTFDGEED